MSSSPGVPSAFKKNSNGYRAGFRSIRSYPADATIIYSGLWLPFPHLKRMMFVSPYHMFSTLDNLPLADPALVSGSLMKVTAAYLFVAIMDDPLRPQIHILIMGLFWSFLCIGRLLLKNRYIKTTSKKVVWFRCIFLPKQCRPKCKLDFICLSNRLCSFEMDKP